MKPKYEVGQECYCFIGAKLKRLFFVEYVDGWWKFKSEGDNWLSSFADVSEIFTTREEGIAMFETMLEEVGL